MNLAGLESDLYRRLGFSATPDNAVTTRLRAYINQTQREILSMKGLTPLRRAVLPFSSVIDTPMAALPQAAVRVVSVVDRLHETYLTPQTLDQIHLLDPGGTAVSATPHSYAIINLSSGTMRNPVAAGLSVVSSHAADDGTKAVYLEGVASSGEPFRLQAALNGSAPVVLSTAQGLVVQKFYLALTAGGATTATGTITLTDGTTATGTLLASIGYGRSYARYTTLHLYPTPNLVISYHAEVELHIEDMAQVGDEAYLPEDFAWLLISGALLKEYQRLEKTQLYTNERSLYQVGLADLKLFVARANRPASLTESHRRPGGTGMKAGAVSSPGGTMGPAGPGGSPGPQGPGVAPGGATGQVLVKTSPDDYETAWADAPDGGGGGGVEEVFVGTSDPGTPYELWFDTDAILEPPTPALHAPSHENGGTDEISVDGLFGLLGEPQTPINHHETHEPGGADVLTLTAASQLLGRGDSGPGAMQQIMVGHGLSIIGTELQATAQSSTTFNYSFSNLTTPPPQARYLRLNSALPYMNVTRIYASTTSDTGGDIKNLLLLIQPGSKLYVQQTDDSLRFVTCTLDAAPIDQGTYVELTVTPTNAGTVAIGNNADSVLMVGAGAPSTLPTHHATHDTGGTDPIAALDGSVITTGTVADARLSPNVLKYTGGYPGGTTTWLRADGTFAAPTAVPGPHADSHEPGGSDAIDNLSGNTITSGTVADARLSANVLKYTGGYPGGTTNYLRADGTFAAPAAGGGGDVYKDQANVFTQNQTISKTRPEVVMTGSGVTAKGRLASVGDNDIRITSNVMWNGGGFDLDDTTKPGLNLELGGGALYLHAFTTGANPRPWNTLLSITPVGNTTIAGTLTVNNPAGSNVAGKAVANVFTGDQTINKGTPMLRLVDTAAPAEQRVFRIYGSANGNMAIDAMNDVESIQQSIPLALNRGGDAFIGRDIYEKGRSTPMGHWLTYAPSFSGWSCASYAAQYSRIGKTAWITFTTLNANIPSSIATITLTIPSGIVAAYTSMGTIMYNAGATTWTNGICWCDNGQSSITINRAGQAAFPAGAIWLYLTIMIPIQ